MTSSAPLASVIVPAYNCEPYIDKCLGSLQRQGFRDFEVIVVDDGSTDGTAAVVDSFVNADSRFRLIRTENHGVSHARNTALDHMAGDFVLFVDADDWVAPDYVETLVRPLLSGESNCSSCGIASVFDDGAACFICGERIEYSGLDAQVSMLDKPRGFCGIRDSLHLLLRKTACVSTRALHSQRTCSSCSTTFRYAARWSTTRELNIVTASETARQLTASPILIG